MILPIGPFNRRVLQPWKLDPCRSAVEGIQQSEVPINLGDPYPKTCQTSKEAPMTSIDGSFLNLPRTTFPDSQFFRHCSKHAAIRIAALMLELRSGQAIVRHPCYCPKTRGKMTKTRTGVLHTRLSCSAVQAIAPWTVASEKKITSPAPGAIGENPDVSAPWTKTVKTVPTPHAHTVGHGVVVLSNLLSSSEC